MHHVLLLSAALAVLLCGGCRESLSQTDARSLEDAPGSCAPLPLPEPAATWAADVLWERSITTTSDLGDVVGIIQTPEATLTFLTRGMVRTSNDGENPIEFPYADDLQYESVIRGTESAVAVISPEKGEITHRFCLLDLAGALDMTTCLDLSYSPIPNTPRWNGEQFQMLVVEPDTLILRAMTGEGVAIEDSLLARRPSASNHHDVVPLGAGQFMTMTGILGQSSCSSAWGQRVVAGSAGPLTRLSPDDHRDVGLWKAHSDNEALILHSSQCIPDSNRCTRSEGSALLFSSRILEDGEIITSRIPLVLGGTAEMLWDGQSFVAIAASAHRLTAYIFDDGKLEGVAQIPSADVSNHPIAIAIAPHEYLVAFRGYTGGHRLMRIKARPQ